MSSLFLVLCCISVVLGDGFEATLGHLKPRSRPQVQERAAAEVIKRLIPEKASLFHVAVDPDIGPNSKDTFKIEKLEGEEIVNITGTSGVAAVWGFHHYLKYYCYCHVSWEADQLALPEVLPTVNITITSPNRFRYYQNVCTSSYSFVWWDWNRWEREIDWMALNGINLALAFTGQEAIWQRVYSRLNLSQNDINEHFSGPAFLAWLRMGNMRGFGGPLPDSWHLQALSLQHKILSRMRELGIIPVLPAFAGHVPRAFKRLYPNTTMTQMTIWNHFPDEFCCPYLLEPTEPLFKTVGSLFISELQAEFGTDHIYNCDTFNEMQPHTSNLTYLSEVSRAIYAAMTDVDPQAIWMLQGWLFNDVLFWTEARVQAFLTSIPTGKMIVLDLQSELNPQYKRLQSYFGQPFIWCMLHNFGGTLGLYGAVENVNQGVFDGQLLENSTMVGTGLTPEGINQNYVMYDLMNEMGWRREPTNLTEWFSAFQRRRYGTQNEHAERAWNLLMSSVYSFTGMRKVRGKYVICRRPSTRLRSWSSVYNCTTNSSTCMGRSSYACDLHPSLKILLCGHCPKNELLQVWYNISDVVEAWGKLLKASPELQNSEAYRHDLVDVTRQALQIAGADKYNAFMTAYRKQNTISFQQEAQNFLNVLTNLDEILASSKDFLLGPWLESAKALGSTLAEKLLYEYNARNQITLWGPNGQIVDYANKQWAGVASHYFLPRWTVFLKALNTSLVSGTPFNETLTREQIFTQVEQPFCHSTSTFPVTPIGDSIVIATRIYNELMPHFNQRQQQRRSRHRHGTLSVSSPRTRVMSFTI